MTRTPLAAAAVAIAFAAAPALANPLMTADPVRALAAHDFDDEHAHLWFESRFDRMSQAELAALPRGKAHIAWNAPSSCVPGRLKAVLNRVSRTFGPITVNSSVRSSAKNRKVGGRKRSYHLSCQAVDFRVHGGTKGMMGWLARQGDVGGLHRYPSGFYHIDTGPRRSW
ncbi:MAG: YcbK family protein [Phyllobacteriaceae bacterium]|nr:YcbK family protein [Phyllobacteriaceae bacterium]